VNIGKFNLATLIWQKHICLLLFLSAVAISSSAQTFTTLLSFDGTNGADPFSTMIQGFDGNLYGTTQDGGPTNTNPPARSSRSHRYGTLTTLYTFCSQPGCLDGKFPAAGLALGIDGNFYGTTVTGGYPASARAHSRGKRGSVDLLWKSARSGSRLVQPFSSYRGRFQD